MALAAILAIAAALRLIALAWGSPYVYHPDEWVLASPALDMLRNHDWNPRLFMYPSGMIYVERFLISTYRHFDPSASLMAHSTGGAAGLGWRGPADALPAQFAYFYLGRLFVAILGTLTAIPVFFSARSASNTIGGLAAAVAIAVAPLAVLDSHYLTTDVPVAAACALVLWFSLKGLRGHRRWLIAAGFAAGVAASIKYNGGLVVIVPVVALAASVPIREWLRPATLRTGVLIALASIVGFVLLTPAVLFDTGSVWTGGIIFQLQQYHGHPGAEGTDNAIYWLGRLWSVDGLGIGLAVLSTLGLAIAVIAHRKTDVVVLSFVVAYYVLVSLPPVRFDRNLLPLLPYLAVLVGRAVAWLAGLVPRAFRRRPPRFQKAATLAAVVAIVVVVGAPSLARSASSDALLNSPDTRTIALTWIEQNVPTGARIAREEFTPQLPPDRYKIGFVWLLADKSLDWYRSKKFDYLIVSSFQYGRYLGHEPQSSFYDSVMALPVVLDLSPQAGEQGPRIVMVRLSSPAAPPGGSPTNPAGP